MKEISNSASLVPSPPLQDFTIVEISLETNELIGLFSVKASSVENAHIIGLDKTKQWSDRVFPLHGTPKEAFKQFTRLVNEFPEQNRDQLIKKYIEIGGIQLSDFANPHIINSVI